VMKEKKKKTRKKKKLVCDKCGSDGSDVRETIDLFVWYKTYMRLYM